MIQWIVFALGAKVGTPWTFIGPFSSAESANGAVERLREAGIHAFADELVTTQEAIQRHGK